MGTHFKQQKKLPNHISFLNLFELTIIRTFKSVVDKLPLQQKNKHLHIHTKHHTNAIKLFTLI
jgi:hypothetical protein